MNIPSNSKILSNKVLLAKTITNIDEKSVFSHDFKLNNNYNVADYNKIRNILTENEFIDELKNFVKVGNYIKAGFFKEKNTIVLFLSVGSRDFKLGFDTGIVIANIPISFYLKVINIIPIDIKNLCDSISENMAIIEFYNSMPDEERLKIELDDI